jgi:hypothetical protein
MLRVSTVRLSSRRSAVRLLNMPAIECGTLPNKLPTITLLPAAILGPTYGSAQAGSDD